MSKQSRYLLIAEDDTFLADMMAKQLAKHNALVMTAHNGKEAVEVLKKRLPDLMLLDLLLPGLDGFGVLQAMKDKGLRCPVIIVSNLSDKKSKEKCRAFGVKEYFIKSDMDDDALWPAIDKYLRQ